jgi:hypothetical protein
MSRDKDKPESPRNPPAELKPRVVTGRHHPPVERPAKNSGEDEKGPGLRRVFDKKIELPPERDNEAPLSDRKIPPPPRNTR